MLVVLNIFIRKRTVTKSTDERSDFSNGQASKLYRMMSHIYRFLFVLVLHFILLLALLVMLCRQEISAHRIKQTDYRAYVMGYLIIAGLLDATLVIYATVYVLLVRLVVTKAQR